jgi:hypothetical protein
MEILWWNSKMLDPKTRDEINLLNLVYFKTIVLEFLPKFFLTYMQCFPVIIISYWLRQCFIQSNLAIRNGLIRNKLVLRNHFQWPICHLLHKDKELLALRNNFLANQKVSYCQLWLFQPIPLLICTWFFKNQVVKMKCDKLDF